MPISPSQVFDVVDQEWIDQAVKYIDSRLSNPDWVRGMTCDSLKNPHLCIIISNERNEITNNTLKELYIKAGWQNVSINRSSDNGERPGFTNITLYKNAQ